jgi:hypothetical protein
MPQAGSKRASKEQTVKSRLFAFAHYTHTNSLEREFPLLVKLLMGIGGAEGDRTPDLMTASHALSQLSYGPR